MNSVSSMDIGYPSEVDYRPAALKKDVRKLQTDKLDYGLNQTDRLLIGVSDLALSNEDMFLSGVVDESERVIRQANQQIERMESDVFLATKEMASLLEDASGEDCLYVSYFSDVLQEMQENYGDMYDLFMSEYGGPMPGDMDD